MLKKAAVLNENTEQNPYFTGLPSACKLYGKIETAETPVPLNALFEKKLRFLLHGLDTSAANSG